MTTCKELVETRDSPDHLPTAQLDVAGQGRKRPALRQRVVHQQVGCAIDNGAIEFGGIEQAARPIHRASLRAAALHDVSSGLQAELVCQNLSPCSFVALPCSGSSREGNRAFEKPDLRSVSKAVELFHTKN